MGNHEFCEDCERSTFHRGEPCDPADSAAVKAKREAAEERRRRAVNAVYNHLVQHGIPAEAVIAPPDTYSVIVEAFTAAAHLEKYSPAAPRYYESHITISPVEGRDLLFFQEVCRGFNFKVADLLMVKDRKITNERSNLDSFATGHGRTEEELLNRTKQLVEKLKNLGFQVWRWKIEACLHDEKLPRNREEVDLA